MNVRKLCFERDKILKRERERERDRERQRERERGKEGAVTADCTHCTPEEKPRTVTDSTSVCQALRVLQLCYIILTHLHSYLSIAKILTLKPA